MSKDQTAVALADVTSAALGIVNVAKRLLAEADSLDRSAGSEAAEETFYRAFATFQQCEVRLRRYSKQRNSYRKFANHLTRAGAGMVNALGITEVNAHAAAIALGEEMWKYLFPLDENRLDALCPMFQEWLDRKELNFLEKRIEYESVTVAAWQPVPMALDQATSNTGSTPTAKTDHGEGDDAFHVATGSGRFPVEKRNMAECFLFFRFWPGFTDSFPVDQFNSLADDELQGALELFAKEEIRRPEVREEVKQEAKRRSRKLKAAILRQSRRRTGPTVPGAGRRIPKREWYWPRIRGASRTDPLICRLGAYRGWWNGGRRGTSAEFGPLVWFARVSSQEIAEIIVSELNARRGLDYDANELEHHLRPRFGLAKEMGIAQQVAAQRCVNAIQAGEEPDISNRKAALLMGQKAMRIADELTQSARVLGIERNADSPDNGRSTPPTSMPKQDEGKGGAGVALTAQTTEARCDTVQDTIRQRIPQSLMEIADTARLLYTFYQKGAADYRRAKSGLEFVRNAVWRANPEQATNAFPEKGTMLHDALHDYKCRSEHCYEMAMTVGNLGHATATLLPGLWPSLRLVGLGARWHEDEEFNWDAAIAELRQIEAAALSAAHNTSLITPAPDQGTGNASNGLSSAGEIAALCDEFLGRLGNYRTLADLIIRWGEIPTREDSEACFAEYNHQLRSEAEWLCKNGPALAGALVRPSIDSTAAKGVLLILHCIGEAGCGPSAVRPEWENVKIALQLALIQLRKSNPMMPAVRPNGGEGDDAFRADRLGPTRTTKGEIMDSLLPVDCGKIYAELSELAAWYLDGQDSGFLLQRVRLSVKRLRALLPRDLDLVDGVSVDEIQSLSDFVRHLAALYHLDNPTGLPHPVHCCHYVEDIGKRLHWLIQKFRPRQTETGLPSAPDRLPPSAGSAPPTGSTKGEIMLSNMNSLAFWFSTFSFRVRQAANVLKLDDAWPDVALPQLSILVEVLEAVESHRTCLDEVCGTGQPNPLTERLIECAKRVQQPLTEIQSAITNGERNLLALDATGRFLHSLDNAQPIFDEVYRLLRLTLSRKPSQVSTEGLAAKPEQGEGNGGAGSTPTKGKIMADSFALLAPAAIDGCAYDAHHLLYESRGLISQSVLLRKLTECGHPVQRSRLAIAKLIEQGAIEKKMIRVPDDELRRLLEAVGVGWPISHPRDMDLVVDEHIFLQAMSDATPPDKNQGKGNGGAERVDIARPGEENSSAVTNAGAPAGAPAGHQDVNPESEEVWPPAEGWGFRPGEAAYNGKILSLVGIKWKLLQALVEQDRPLTVDELRDFGWASADQPDTKTMRTQLSQLRKLLRRKLILKADFDPIPRQDRGELLAWKLHAELR